MRTDTGSVKDWKWIPSIMGAKAVLLRHVTEHEKPHSGEDAWVGFVLIDE